MAVRETLPGAVALTVNGPLRRPALHVEIAGPRRMLLRQSGNPILLARVDDDHGGVAVRRLPGYRSPLPPLRADEGRRHPHWPHRFADVLTASDRGPLHAGRWLLHTRHTLPPYTWSGDFLADWPGAHIDWWRGCTPIVPLRPLSDPDAPRVKAYRRRAREHVLPPVLLWDISAFDGWMILDGHDRAVAALAEGREPTAVVLSRATTPADQADLIATVVDHHAEVLSHTRGDAAAVRQVFDRQLTALAASVPYDSERTLAWPGGRGAADWDGLWRVARSMEAWVRR